MVTWPYMYTCACTCSSIFHHLLSLKDNGHIVIYVLMHMFLHYFRVLMLRNVFPSREYLLGCSPPSTQSSPLKTDTYGTVSWAGQPLVPTYTNMCQHTTKPLLSMDTQCLQYMYSTYHVLLAVTCVLVVLRFQDASASVRLECVRFSKYFLVYHPHLAEDTTGVCVCVCVCVWMHPPILSLSPSLSLSLSPIAKLFDRLKDADEKVRLEAVKVVCEVAAESLPSVPLKVSHNPQVHVHVHVYFIQCTCTLR